MNKDQMKNNVGKRVLLLPPARRIQPDGSVRPPIEDDWWLVDEVTSDGVRIIDQSGVRFRVLGYDHIYKFTSDQPRDGFERGFLSLHVQLVANATDIEVVPNTRPGEPAAELRAIASFGPELQRVFRRQVQILDRILPNFMDTSHNRVPQTGDTWVSLAPFRPDHYPTSSLLQDLDATDVELLAEFYNAVRDVGETLEHWSATEEPLDNYNAWNVIMQRVQQSLRLGQAAVRRFCPDRAYDPLVPPAGTLLVRSERSLASADQAANNFQERCKAAGGSVPVSNLMGLRPNRTQR